MGRVVVYSDSWFRFIPQPAETEEMLDWKFIAQLVESACNAGDLGSILGLGRSSGEGNGNPLQYSCLENPIDRGSWQAAVHGIIGVGHDLATKPPEHPMREHWFLL